jgi:hypothetical protein
MKHLIALMSLLFLISCKGEKHDNPTQAPTPEAFKDATYEISSLRKSSNDLVEELYRELMDKTPELKQLDGEINALYTGKIAICDGFNDFDDKSKRYYNTVLNEKLMSIRDSNLKQKIRLLITKSQDKYTDKTAELNNLIKTINANDVALKDYYLAFKITKTMAILEKYQADNLPNSKGFKDLINQQKTLIEKLNNLLIK